MTSFRSFDTLRFALVPAGLLAMLSWAPTARAQAVEAPKPKPPPYSLPFQLRPVVAGTVVRSDTALAFYESPANGESGTTVASMLLASYKLTDELAPLVRVVVVQNSPLAASAPSPDPPSGFGILNPVLGVTYALKLDPSLRLGLFLGVTVPVGSGGGNEPELENTLANGAGIRARSAMDNAMFAVNDFTVFPGVGLAYVAHGFTAQVEATVLQLTRVRGDEVQPDSSKTNFTAGIHLGYFFAPFISAAVELRHQRWLSTPAQIENDATGTLRDTTTVAIGPRFHVQLAEKAWFRPAVTFAMPLEGPMADAKDRIVQLDLPFAF